MKWKTGMLGIDHHHGRFEIEDSGADQGILGGLRPGAICRQRREEVHG
jgi:hypothetical protein